MHFDDEFNHMDGDDGEYDFAPPGEGEKTEDVDAGVLVDLLQRLREFHETGGEDEPPAMEGMSAADYHNRAIDYVRRGDNRHAVALCREGLALYPMNVDLLADTIKYASEMGDLDTAQEHYELLCRRIPRSHWNWRAFTFSFDYLVADVAKNEAECRQLVQDYERYLPYEEKGRMSHAELEAECGNHERSMAVLVEAVRTLPNAPQCALRLADMQLERGLYADVIKTVGYGLAASAETQPTINVPYLYYVRALAQDALLHRKYVETGSAGGPEVARLRRDYRKMLEVFPQLRRHRETIEMRIHMLEFLEGEA